MRKIFPFLKKEFIEIIRDRLSLISILFLPSILLFLYGYAISLDVKDIRVTLCDLDRSSFSRDFVDSLTSLRGWNRGYNSKCCPLICTTDYQ